MLIEIELMENDKYKILILTPSKPLKITTNFL